MAERQPSTLSQGSAWAVHLVLLLVQLAFASLAVEGKLAMSPEVGVDPTALAAARILGGAAVFVALGLISRNIRARSPREIAQLAGLSLLGIVVNQVLYLHGLRETSPLSATLLIATVPIFAAAISIAFGRDRLTRRTLAGLGLAVFGILILTGFQLPKRGDALVLINALSYSFYLVLMQDLARRLGAIETMSWVFGLGALLFLPWGGRALLIDMPSWSPLAWGLVAIVVLVATVFTYLGNAWAIARATPGTVAVYVYLQPIFVAIIAFLQLGEPVGLRTIGAGALILLGVGLVAQRRVPKRSVAAGREGS